MTDSLVEELPTPRKQFVRFLQGDTDDKVFISPIDDPCGDTGFCRCEGSALQVLPFYAAATLLEIALKLPFNSIKIWLLRRMGASIGSNVFISVGVHIDPNFPQLLTIEDDVLVGMEARIMFHELRRREFRAGKITIRKGSLIGAFSIIGPGVEIGEDATVAAGAVVGRDVPSGATIVGNPARVVPVA